MRRSHLLAVLLLPLLALATMAGPALGADAVTRIYQVTATNEEFPEEQTLYLSVTMKGSEFVLVVLDPLSPWYYGVGEINGLQAGGEMFDPIGEEPTPLGSFALQFGDDDLAVAGTIRSLSSEPLTVTGMKIF